MLTMTQVISLVEFGDYNGTEGPWNVCPRCSLLALSQPTAECIALVFLHAGQDDVGIRVELSLVQQSAVVCTPDSALEARCLT